MGHKRLLGIWLASALPLVAADESLLDAGARHEIWQNGIGSGFTENTYLVGVAAGAGFGVRIFGSSADHDFALANLGAGWIMTDVVCRDTWWRGNWELRGEFFGGEQLEPERYVIGITPSLRYHFATGTRVVPFLHGGVGTSLTDIKGPDMSTTFQFNLTGGGGLNFFVRENLALSAEYRFFHLSNAGIEQPNGGANAHMFFGGISWWF